MHRPILPLALAGLAATIACAPVERQAAATDPAADAPAVKVLGEGQNCISRSTILQSRVQSDRVIDFEMRGGKIYRSVLPSECPGLGFERAFTYNTQTDRLCNTDIIYVLRTTGGQPERGVGCGLGKFVPVEYIRDAK
ncbi:MAG: hypothetical protein GC147_02675 [Porphyrobacter sp.]|nr:hypothetical protein [Porphyrobacter sp.]